MGSVADDRSAQEGLRAEPMGSVADGRSAQEGLRVIHMGSVADGRSAQEVRGTSVHGQLRVLVNVLRKGHLA